MTKKVLRDLANRIHARIYGDFTKTHLSRNLMNTLEIRETQNGIEVEIPAEMYDIPLYIMTGVIVHTGEGSYAQEVNKTGGFSGKHLNYVEEAISQSITEWAQYNRIGIKGVDYYD